MRCLEWELISNVKVGADGCLDYDPSHTNDWPSSEIDESQFMQTLILNGPNIQVCYVNHS